MIKRRHLMGYRSAKAASQASTQETKVVESEEDAEELRVRRDGSLHN